MVTGRGTRALRPRFMIAWSVGLVVWATAAWAVGTPEESCQAGRAKAAGKYAKCIQNEVAKYYSTGGDPAKLGKCLTKYGATWARLQAKALASPGAEICDAARFVDNGNGTVTDNLTTLQWEQKGNLDTTPNLADLHDADNLYTWSTSSQNADGAAFTSFLAGLNAAGFAGQYDWRLPTQAELLSTTQPAYPDCSVAPCLDPIFGPTVSSYYWSSPTYGNFPTSAWVVSFFDGNAFAYSKTFSAHVRAVRGGF